MLLDRQYEQKETDTLATQRLEAVVDCFHAIGKFTNLRNQSSSAPSAV